MEDFEGIIDKAKDIFALNLEIAAKKSEKLNDAESSSVESIDNDSGRTKIFENSIAYKTILALGFQVLRSERHQAILTGVDVETYFCMLNQYVFAVKFMPDSNNPKKFILNLYDPKHLESGETIDVVVDILNEATKPLLDKVVKIMKLGLDNYVAEEFRHYLELPMLLKRRGFHVEENGYAFTLSGCRGYLRLNDMCYIRIYEGQHGEMEFAVCNKPQWDVNSRNGYFGYKGYKFNYRSSEDFDELCKCIDAFIEVLDGRYGYLQNGAYYKNEDIEEMIKVVKSKIKSQYSELYGKIYIDIMSDSKTEENEKNVVNHYNGFDIFKAYTMEFNCNKDIGDYIERYNFVFSYNRFSEKQKCILNVSSKIYTDYCVIGSNGKSTEYKEEIVLEESDHYEGTFIKVLAAFESLILSLLHAHNIVLK